MPVNPEGGAAAARGLAAGAAGAEEADIGTEPNPSRTPGQSPPGGLRAGAARGLRRLAAGRPGGSLNAGTVFDIRRYSIHDGPGIRTTVFLKGCALSCWWCHNPESQATGPEAVLHEGRCIRCGACANACPHGAVAWVDGAPVTDRSRCEACGTCTLECHAEAREIAGRTMTVEQVLAVVERDRPFYDESRGGLTLSGGEPLLQPHFSADLLAAAKRQGLHTVLDTCGHTSWESFERLRGDVDLFLYDLKLVDAARHKHYTGVSNDRILANLRRLSELGHRIVLRIPVVPGVTDDAENVLAVRTFAASLPQLARIDLLPYHRIGIGKYQRLDRTYQLPHTESPTRERMDEIASFMAAGGLPVGRD